MDRAITSTHGWSVSKTFQPYTPRQAYLLPPSPSEWLREGHLAYFILDVVQELDLSRIYGHYERELRGKPPHDPRLMVGLLLYGYCTGVSSSRQIERRTYEDVAFHVIAGGTHPDHVSISEFRRVHLDALGGLFLQVLKLCQKAGMVKLGHVALDGTKVKANASKHKAMSYSRMKEQELALARRVAELLAKAKEVDAREDAEHGPDKRGDELPEELSRAQSRLERIRQAKAELEAEAKAAREKEKKEPDPEGGSSSGSGGGGTPLPSHRIPTDDEGTPTPKAQRNFTDPESRIMVSGDGGFVQAYNAQVVVDAENQVIVAQAVTNQPPDVEHAVPMLDQVADNCGHAPDKVTMDAGYFSEENVLGVLAMQVDPYIATGRTKHGAALPAKRRALQSVMPVKDWMRARLESEEGAAIYRRRKAIVEPVFGQIKHARGFRTFGLRGLRKVRGEFSLVATAHNLRKLYRRRSEPLTPS